MLSIESLRHTGYFDANAVQRWRKAFRAMREGAMQRMSVEMGLAGVLTTQLWHHTYIDGCLADVKSLASAARMPEAA